jgi:hypothetical protein
MSGHVPGSRCGRLGASVAGKKEFRIQNSEELYCDSGELPEPHAPLLDSEFWILDSFPEDHATRSNMPAAPIPPPTHMVTIP